MEKIKKIRMRIANLSRAMISYYLVIKAKNFLIFFQLMFYKRYLKFKTGYKDVTDIALRHKNTLKMSKKLESGNESYIQFNFYYIYQDFSLECVTEK